METISKLNATTEKLIAGFELSKNNLFGDIIIREQAMESFVKQGIPGRKHEEYKYVNMELALKGDFALTSSKNISSDQISKLKIVKDAVLLVLVNGKFNAELSELKSIKGLYIS